MSSGIFKILLVATWVVLLGLLVTRDLFVPNIDNMEIALLEKARQERYYGVWFDHRRIGYVAEILQPEGQDVILNQEAHLLLNVLDSTQPIDMVVHARLSAGQLLKEFTFHFKSPYYTMSARGEVKGNEVHFTLDTGQSTITDTVTLTAPPLLAVNNRKYLLDRLTKEGQRIKVPSFDPISLSGRESIVTYHGQEKTLVRRNLKFLHHFSETTAGMRVNFWLDDNGLVVQEESPAGFKFIAEPEFRAKDIVSSGNELLSSVAIPLEGNLPAAGSKSVTYRLGLPPDLNLDLQGGRQDLRDNLLTVTLEEMPARADQETGGASAAEFLKPSLYVQSENEEIVNQSRSIVGAETDPAVRIRLLAQWVYRNLEKRPVIGLPDALTTLRNKRGDCNEHASLFAALARSAGIPTAIATGVTLLNGAFYYHAWNEVCLDGTWYSLDTTTNQIPADLFHLRFGRGDMDQQLKIGGLLGKLQITILPQRN